MNSFYNNCIFYDENNNLNNSFKNVEDGTRFLINKYIKPNMNVLELGARYKSPVLFIIPSPPLISIVLLK